ncbi:Protein CBG18560 [Caenorhabditis briggsae]|uniref:Protein CBG18560 n=1 Tax=Caenorhabditis briggsae TaxID=6238 RepID=A8XTK8_CAEBR|nr:Protein CBG18560 [Caenorhabditis briggsae]CAP35985.2 Protein CBG18560 [Caenorhabditis briggsae]
MHQHLNSHHKKEVEEMERSIVHKDQEPRHQIIGKNDAIDDLAIAMCSSTVPFRFLRNKHFREFCRKLNPDHQILDSRSSKVWIFVDGWSAKYMDSELCYKHHRNKQDYFQLLGIEPISASATAA